jgi:hypothetical protein
MGRSEVATEYVEVLTFLNHRLMKRFSGSRDDGRTKRGRMEANPQVLVGGAGPVSSIQSDPRQHRW